MRLVTFFVGHKAIAPDFIQPRPFFFFD